MVKSGLLAADGLGGIDEGSDVISSTGGVDITCILPPEETEPDGTRDADTIYELEGNDVIGVDDGEMFVGERVHWSAELHPNHWLGPH